MNSRVVLLTVLLAAWGNSTVAAQRLHGRLIDLVSDQPIPAGILTLLTEDGDPMATVVTDEAGNWVLNAPSPGHYYVEAKRLGYQPWIDGPVTVRRGEDWNAVYHLRPLAVRLDPVEVSAQATVRYLELTGFYDRQRGNFGHFVEPEAIERRQAAKVTELLGFIPGVRLVSTGGGLGRTQVQMRGSHQVQGGLCRPRIFVDGLIYNRGDSRPFGLDGWGNPERALDPNENRELLTVYEEVDIDDIVHPSSIAGIEVYRSGAQVPVRFGGTSIQTRCGVIVIWTKAGQIRRRRR
jgi:hypothetical protein